MIPQNLKDILGNTMHAGLLQTLALLIFVVFFAITVILVMRKPKNFYNDEANSPLNDNETEI